MVGLDRMETGRDVYSQKPAWLRDLQVDQSRKTVKMNRHSRMEVVSING